MSLLICQINVYLKAHDKPSGLLEGTQQQEAQMKSPETEGEEFVVKHLPGI